MKIINGDCLTELKKLPDESVHCCVTSPPYWGLRDYGVDGQIGLEKTPDEYVEKLVNVFREVKRVLKNDGVLFLNLGDSYYGSGKGQTKNGCNDPKQPKLHGMKLPVNVQREAAYGISDKAPEDYQVRGCLCENLCDECRRVYQNRKFHNGNSLLSKLIASLSLPIHERKELLNDHLPTLDFFLLEAHILNAIRDFGNLSSLSAEQILSSQESMPDEFSRQLLDECLRRGNSSSCLLCGCSLAPYVHRNENKLACTCGTSPISSFLGDHIYNNYNVYPYLYYGNEYRNCQYLKNKDLIGIPWRVAFALQADGWYLRQDIIWAKPNPMPESVTDRCTKSHEYIFLLTKSARYYYNHDAIKERQSESSAERALYGWNGRNDDGSNGARTGAGIRKMKESGMSMGEAGLIPLDGMRNKRSVWSVTTQPYKEAHFATFPEEIPRTCILAGSKKGDTILDPFSGAGTTGVVAEKLNRKYIGIELNPQYTKMAEDRIYNVQPLFAGLEL